MQEPNQNLFSGLKLDQIKSIEKVEDGKFTISSSLVMAEGSFITSTASEDPSAVVINEQLTKAEEKLNAAHAAEEKARIAGDQEISDALATYQASNDAALKEEVSNRESADKSIQAALDTQEAKQESEKVAADADRALMRTEFAEADADIQKALDAQEAKQESENSERVADIDAANAERAKAVQGLQDQLDFLLSGSTEEFDTLLEILDHIKLIDTENDATLDAAIVSINASIQTLSDESQAGDKAEQEARTEAIADLQAVVDALSTKQASDEADIEAKHAALADKQSADNAARVEDNADRVADIADLSDLVAANESDIEAKVAKEVVDRETADKAIQEALDTQEAKQESEKVAADADRALMRTEFAAADKAIQEALDTQEAKQASDNDARKSDIDAANEERAKAVKAVQDQIDFLLSGSTTNLDQVKELVAFIESTDLENDNSLLAAVATINESIKSLSEESQAGDAAEAKLRTEAISDLQAVVDALSTKQASDEADIEDKMATEIADRKAGDKLNAEALADYQASNDAEIKSLFATLDEDRDFNSTERKAIEALVAENEKDIEEKMAQEIADREAGDKNLSKILDEDREFNSAERKAIEALVAENEKDIEEKMATEIANREEGDKVNAEAIQTLQDQHNAEIKELNATIETAVSEAVQNSDFTQESVSLAGKLDGDVVEFTIPGNIGVILTFVEGLFVPSTTTYNEGANETTVSFTMYFDAEATSMAHYVSVNFS